MSLNPAQRAAVDHGHGPLLINATAGSGKTRTITERTAALIERGVDPDRLLLVTFTNKAAREMKERIAKRVGQDLAKAVWAGTFHSVCRRLLRSFQSDAVREGRTADFSIYDEDDSLGCIKGAMNELELDSPATPNCASAMEPKAIREWVSRMKALGLEPADLREEAHGDELAVAQYLTWKRYEAILRANNAFDFDDLLCVTMRAAESESDAGLYLRSRWTHVLVDEYQDTSEVQFRIVRALGSSRNVTVVGDINQSLYAWRGAKPDNILDFARTHYPDAAVVDMKTNYRSTRRIVAFANAFVSNGDAEAAKDEGEAVMVRGFYDEDAEARFVADDIQARLRKGVPASECVVLYRNHVLSRAIEDQLRNRGVRYDIVGGTTFYERRVVKDILGYLRLIVNPESNLDFERVVNNPPRGLGDKAVAKIRERAREKNVSLTKAVMAALAEGVITGKPAASVQRFMLLLKHAHADLATKRPSEVASDLLTTSGFRAFLAERVEKKKKEGKHADAEKAARDVEHVEAVVAALTAYEARTEGATMQGYLDEVALVTAQDNAKGDKVLLSTIHGYKGLEADCVWVIGFEQGVLPPKSAQNDFQALAEEKRVAFVACSRARKYMAVTYSAGRVRYGKYEATGPSDFLGLVSPDCMFWPERDRHQAS